MKKKMLAKIADNETKECSIALGGDISYYKKIGYKEMDITCKRERYYVSGYEPSDTIEEQVSDLYNTMVKDVYAKMEEVFGTRNDVSAQAFATTYDAMAKRPENYIGAYKRSGEVLNTAEEVAAYANEIIAAIDKYGAWRLARIAQFDADKKKILDGLKKKK